jgi:hypothetical protein
MSQTAFAHLYQEELYRTPSSVTIVLSKAWEDYSADQHVLLGKILASVKLSLSAVRIISLSSFTLSSLEAFGSTNVLVFGSGGEAFTPYQLIRAQGFSVIKADDLDALDDAKKKSLWLALKSMFGI